MFQEFFSKRTDREKKCIYITMIIVLVAVLDGLFIGPLMANLKVVDDEITTQKNSIIRDLRVLTYKDRIIKESSAYEKYFTDAIEDDDVINSKFLSVLERLATKTNVSLIKSTPSQTKRSKEYIEYFATLDCMGPLKDVVSFMHSINSTDDLLKIVRFNMTPKRGTSDEVNVSMTISKMIVNPNLSIEASNP